jgi:uncharacterized protein YjbJ (UPF0337 family)
MNKTQEVKGRMKDAMGRAAKNRSLQAEGKREGSRQREAAGGKREGRSQETSRQWSKLAIV